MILKLQSAKDYVSLSPIILGTDKVSSLPFLYSLDFWIIKFIFHIEIFLHTGISRADTVLIVFFARMTNEPQNAACQQKAALATDNCQINRLATCNKGSPEIPCMKILGITSSVEIGFAS